MPLRWLDPDRTLTLSVRDLVEAAPPSGHLVVEVAQTRQARLAAGRAAHQGWQADQAAADAGYRAEHALKHTFEVDGWTVVLHGRVDGLTEEGGRPVVEEVKSTALDADRLAATRPSDWPAWLAQLEIYVWMLAQAGWRDPLGRLVLVSLLDGSRHVVPVNVDLAAIEGAVRRRAARLVRLRERRLAWLAERRRRAVPLPFPRWRAGQQPIAETVRRALSDGRRLLVQAPTGLGKTAAVLQGALAYALGDDKTLFWCTSRGTQTAGVVATLDRFRDRGLPLSYVVLRAKEKVCLNDVVACRPDTCRFARDYHDKLEAGRVVEAAIDAEVVLPEQAVALGRAHEVCPHALLQDASEHVDVVVGDVNHALSPTARVRRLFADPVAAERVVIVDEAHQLVERAREQASPVVDAARARAAIGGCGPGFEPFREVAEGALAAIRRVVDATSGPWTDDEAVAELALGPWQALAERVDQLALDHALLRAKRGLPTEDDPYLDLARELLRFAATAEEAGPETVALVRRTPGREGVRLVCLDPSVHLRPRVAELGGFVGCSATLAPHDFYQRLLGLPEDTARLDVASPFPPERRRVLLSTRVSTRYEDRARHADATAALLSRAAAAVPGNVAIYFPSFVMLDDLMSRFDAGGATVVRQQPGLDDAGRAATLAALDPKAPKTVLAAVLGGIFAEGVDLLPGALSAVFIVGPALPPVGLERDLLRAHFEEQFGAGFRYASLVPGMTRVVQASGRLHRRPEDRGVILLVDRRFRFPEYQALLPAGWTPENVDEPSAAIAAFFAEAP